MRKDLLGRPRRECPTVIDYTVQAKANSVYNTPNVWGVYIFNLVLKWVRDKGGVEGKGCRFNAANNYIMLLFPVCSYGRVFRYQVGADF